MQAEYEARFLSIDVDKATAILRKRGAELHQPRTLMRRFVFKNNDIDAAGGWLRLRDEGHQTTLTYKQTTADVSAIDTILEAEITVSSFDDTHRLLTAMGFQPLRYQENYREEWRLGELRFDFDTWPGVDTYLEIEGPDHEAVQTAATMLSLDMDAASFGSVDDVYQAVLNRIQVHAQASRLSHDGRLRRSLVLITVRRR
jgi:adenylate cyclase class 2